MTISVLVPGENVEDEFIRQAVIEMEEHAEEIEGAIETDRAFFRENPDRWFRFRMTHPGEINGVEYVLVVLVKENVARLRVSYPGAHLLMAAPLHAQESAIRTALKELSKLSRGHKRILKDVLKKHPIKRGKQ